MLFGRGGEWALNIQFMTLVAITERKWKISICQLRFEIVQSAKCCNAHHVALMALGFMIALLTRLLDIDAAFAV